MTGRHTPEDLQLLGTRTAVVVGTALAIVAVFAVLVLAAEVLLLVFAGLLCGVLLSSLADALVRVSGMGRGSYAVTPLIQRRTVSMPPALTIMSQIVLGVLVGGIGVAVATPLTAAAMTVIRMPYVEDLLEQEAAAQPITAAGASRPQTRPPQE
jgi:predicted PurR-regulated permease PerM